MRQSIKILLIEDSAEIQEAVFLVFEFHWPEAKIIQALDGFQGIALAKSGSPDLVILDLGLPDIDGLKVLKEIRAFSQVPVVIFTVRGEGMDKIRGFELGADDYIVKPFSPKEIIARVHAILQRSGKIADEVETVKQVQASQNLSIDFNSGTVVRGDKKFKLTNTELNLLKYLELNYNRVLTDNDILAKVWGNEYVDCTEPLHTYINGLRQKLEDDPANPKIILGDRAGYRFKQPR
jgi:two-component system KDP operon response regulator KdpE